MSWRQRVPVLPRVRWFPARRVRRALVVYCHPDPASLTAAARDRTLAALADADIEVRQHDLYADGFRAEMSADERRSHADPTVIAPDIKRYADDLRWADGLIMIYPTWWSGQPALLKGWIDRVWVAGVAWELPPGANRLKPLLRNIHRIVMVTSHGSPKYVNVIEGETGKRVGTRALRLMCHPLTRTTWCALYGIDNEVAAERDAWLDRVDATMRRL